MANAKILCIVWNQEIISSVWLVSWLKLYVNLYLFSNHRLNDNSKYSGTYYVSYFCVSIENNPGDDIIKIK